MLCDLNAQRLNSTGDEYGIERRYTDYRRMVEYTAPDGVYAIGPPHVIFEVWVWCLQRGLSLYFEKPMGLTQHQAQMLAHLAEAHGCIVQVSFQRRSRPIRCQAARSVCGP